MVMTAHRKHAKKVDCQAEGADEEQLTCLHLWRFEAEGYRLAIVGT